MSTDLDGDAYDAYLEALERGEDPDLDAFLAEQGCASPVLRARLASLRSQSGASERLAPGTALGHYEVRGCLGVGGMGEVLRAFDAELEREVAIKVLPGSIARDPGRLARFRQEARFLAGLDHPAVATVHELLEEEGRLGLVMELVPGQDLARVLAEGPLERRRALELLRQVAAGLGAAHSRGVLHRDLKPANVLVTPDGRAKLVDFGIAKRLPGNGSSGPLTAALAPVPAGAAPATDAAVGTPGYMSPEQAAGEDLDVRSDVFGFGCLLHECLTGRRWRPEDDAPLADLEGFGAANLRELVRACLDADPDERPDSMEVVLRALDRALGGEAPAAGPERRPRVEPPPTSFRGRGQALDELRARLRPGAVCTLVGPGGVGKSRLALELLRDCGAGACAFVDLTAVAEPGGVAPAIVRALCGAPPKGPDLEAELASAVDQAVAEGLELLVLDNAEHLLDPVAERLAQLERRAPGVALLVTSREPVGLSGEALVALPTLAQEPAERLFLDRVALVRPGYEPDPAEREAVAELCRHLDGLPLALELAAARCLALSPAELVEQLGQRFDLLVQRGATTAHHRTLAGMIDWSHELLTPEERAAFRRLAAFSGAFTPEAAVVVAGSRAPVTRLVEQSLVQREGERLRLLETLREYALAKLVEAGERGAAEGAHARHYFAEARRAHEAQNGPERAQAFGALDRDHLELVQALTRARHNPELELEALAAMVDLAEFWLSRGHLAEAEEHLRWGLTCLAPDDHSPLAADLLRVLASMIMRRGRYEEARGVARQALEVARRGMDARREGRALRMVGYLNLDAGDAEGARGDLERALLLVRPSGDTFLISMLLNDLGTLAFRSDDCELALERYGESLALRRSTGDAWGIASCTGNMGEVLQALGRLPEAERHLARSLRLFHDLGDRRSVAESFEMSVPVLVALGATRRAAVLAGAAQDLRQELGYPKSLAEAPAYEELLDSLRASLGDAAYRGAVEAGATMELDEAVRFALEPAV